jgi:hypothetical protein
VQNLTHAPPRGGGKILKNRFTRGNFWKLTHWGIFRDESLWGNFRFFVRFCTSERKRGSYPKLQNNDMNRKNMCEIDYSRCKMTERKEWKLHCRLREVWCTETKNTIRNLRGAESYSCAPARGGKFLKNRFTRWNFWKLPHWGSFGDESLWGKFWKTIPRGGNFRFFVRFCTSEKPTER